MLISNLEISFLYEFMEGIAMKTKKISIRFAKLSIPLNTIIALSKIGLGIMSASFFPAISACYNIGIAIAKYFAVSEHDKSSKHFNDTSEEKKKRELNCYHLIGVIVFISSVIFVLYSFRLFLFEEKTIQYTNIVAIGIATVTFSEIGLAVYGILSARKNDELIVEAIKFTNLATALISLVLTQTALLSFTQVEGNMSLYIGFSGVLFGTISAMIGLLMVSKKDVKKKKKKEKKKRFKFIKWRNK